MLCAAVEEGENGYNTGHSWYIDEGEVRVRHGSQLTEDGEVRVQHGSQPIEEGEVRVTAGRGGRGTTRARRIGAWVRLGSEGYD